MPAPYPDKSKELLKILYIVEASSGGTGKHVLDLCEALSGRGHAIHLLYSPIRQDAPFTAHLERLTHIHKNPIAIHRRIGVADIKAYRDIRKYIRAHGPFDVVHSHSSKAGFFSRVCTPSASVCIHTPHGLVTDNYTVPLAARVLFGVIEHLLSYRSTRIIAVSHYEATRTFAHLHIAKRKIAVIRNGLPPLAFPSREAVRAALGMPGEALCIGYVGMFYPYKGPDLFIRMLHLLKEKVEFNAIILGSGPMEAELRALADHYGLHRRIIWIKGRKGTDIMPAFDMLVLSSRMEAMPYVLLEGMQAGLPIVATQAGEMPAIIREGINGFVAPLESPEALADKVSFLLRSPDLRHSMGEASRTLSAEFTLEGMISQTERLYRKCVGERHG